jgi:hypothetical protein
VLALGEGDQLAGVGLVVDMAVVVLAEHRGHSDHRPDLGVGLAGVERLQLGEGALRCLHGGIAVVDAAVVVHGHDVHHVQVDAGVARRFHDVQAVRGQALREDGQRQ